jgi:lauroyl/myristoyl acyltransferase
LITIIAGVKGPSIRQLVVRAIVAAGNLQRRLLEVFYAVAGPEAAYRLTGWGAHLIYLLLDPLRLRCEAQCRAALGDRLSDEQVRRIAQQSFVHRARNLADLMLARRFLRKSSYQRYGGALAATHLDALRGAQRRAQPLILVTAYYGPFDLLPIFLGYNGIRAGVVYRPHANAGFDAYRRAVRGQSGCELIPVPEAAHRVAEILERGGVVALLADHHVPGRGIPSTFLGVETRTPRAVGVLARQYRADVVAAGIRRLGDAFRFELLVIDTIRHGDWLRRDDPVGYITQRYLRALERLVLKDPSQYLWGYARWGEPFAQQATAAAAEDRDAPPAAR